MDKAKKVVVLNLSGNVGKSTLCRHGLAPRMPGAEMIAVESVNTNGSGKAMDAEQFTTIMKKVMLAETAIVDVGSSNIKEFLSRMNQQMGAHEDVDFFLIPVVADAKQQEDTINTIKLLISMGVEPEKIRIVFNRVKPGEKISETFSTIFAKAAPVVVIPEAQIELNKFFDEFKHTGLSPEELAADTTDYRTLLTTETDQEKRDLYADLIGLKRSQAFVTKSLNKCFEAVFA